MELRLRPLYNSLRINWLEDPSMPVKEWQVDNYRKIPQTALFARLEALGIFLDRRSLAKLAEAHDSPEELVSDLLGEGEVDAETFDQIYLLVFELWRRFLPEKKSLSVFCDSLDHLITLDDFGELDNRKNLVDAIANLEILLDENVDEGIKPLKAFEVVSEQCANDLETFLYDFIAEQIDNENAFYAQELVEGFHPYMKDSKWFDLLHARIQEQTDGMCDPQLLKELVRKAIKEGNFSYNLELLDLLVTSGDRENFVKLVKKSLPLLRVEDDLQDVLALCESFCHCLDFEQEENQIQEVIETRSELPLEKEIDPKDPHLRKICKIIA